MSSPLLPFKFALAICLALAVSLPAYADDTEIYFNQNQTSTSTNDPNVLFIIDTSGSMHNRPKSASSSCTSSSPDAITTDSSGNTIDCRKKLTIVKDIFTNLINNTNGINAALMRFDDAGNYDPATGKCNYNGTASNGGYFLSAMSPIAGTKTQLISDVSGLSACNSTPLAETMFEAARFFMGGAVKFGNSTSPGTDADVTSGLLKGNNYISPIKASCQKNIVVLLTDGKPNTDGAADDDINKLITGKTTHTVCEYGTASKGGDCLDELAGYMHTNDMLTNKTATDGQNTVTTYTIGFDTADNTDAQTLLDNTAKAGGSSHAYTASDSSQLEGYLTDILNQVAEGTFSFVAPSMVLNSYNGLRHYSQMYYAQFQPKAAPKWDGNLKSYYLQHYTAPDAACADVLLDADGNPALEGDTSSASCSEVYKVKKTARSYWSASADGPKVALGGAASLLADTTTNPRKLFTNVGSSNDLSDTTNAFITTNTNVDYPTLGLDQTLSTAVTDRTNLINWARGIDVDASTSTTTVQRKSMGDPLHSQPVIVTYSASDEKNADMTLFLGTNEGFLHAFNVSISNGSNASSGQEQFAFIPKELLANLKTFKNNASTGTAPQNHPYGLDGGITAWVDDEDGVKGINPTKDHVYLYFGMRRGGSNYYALDVANRDAPKFLWEIKSGDTGFEKLGQTWSKPVLATIKVDSGKIDGSASAKPTKVLIFGGGNDTNEDKAIPDSTDSKGNAVYIVDAKTGTLLWSASSSGSDDAYHLAVSNMTYSIPSDVRVVDTNMDGLDDLIYVGDTGGQVFRFDIANGIKKYASSSTTPPAITGGRIADLGGGTTTVGNRRFYNAPDLVLARPVGSQPYLAINIGSGYRAHPLDTSISDRFYSLRDYDVFTIPDTYKTLTESDLVSVSRTTINSANTKKVASSTNGWYFPLSVSGEKVLASSITFDGQVFFTTYYPPSSTTTSTSCSGGSTGNGRLYVVDLFSANPIVASPGANPSTTDPTKLTDADRYTDLKAPGIPPTPVVAFNPDPTPCVGMQCYPKKLSVTINKTYWEQTQ